MTEIKRISPIGAQAEACLVPRPGTGSFCLWLHPGRRKDALCESSLPFVLRSFNRLFQILIYTTLMSGPQALFFLHHHLEPNPILTTIIHLYSPPSSIVSFVSCL
ncbi:uncharacterized protein BDW47DRAFT_106084 [Aspergillus candidus]|uniref:Uncharacterized protein n=1 Tax=Aspergillus candidus TaxID=41067 RepID=A0A2I2FBE5_ASPCN|nr:hypothetical protein BDW47DRAFT_106084 [Aspergillus candidus]PLB37933.1 hypothetical protein BDW47DRAFT_106084 [Aspergillus candidus]